MRGKGCILAGGVGAQGITPAYAGKSCFSSFSYGVVEDHPRVCGEKTKKIPQHRASRRYCTSVSFSLQ